MIEPTPSLEVLIEDDLISHVYREKPLTDGVHNMYDQKIINELQAEIARLKQLLDANTGL